MNWKRRANGSMCMFPALDDAFALSELLPNKARRSIL